MARSTNINSYAPYLRQMLTQKFLTSLPKTLTFQSMREARANRLTIYALRKAALATGTPMEALCSQNLGISAPEPIIPGDSTGPATMVLFNRAEADKSDPLMQLIFDVMDAPSDDADAGGKGAQAAQATQAQTATLHNEMLPPPVASDWQFRETPASALGAYALDSITNENNPPAGAGADGQGVGQSVSQGEEPTSNAKGDNMPTAK